MTAIQNPCPGTGQFPTRRRITSRDLGTKFGGRKMGCCPVEGCDVRLTSGGRLTKHEAKPGAFQKIIDMHVGRK